MLEKGRAHGDLAAAGAVEQGAEPDKGHGQHRAGRKAVEQAGGILRQPGELDQVRRRQRGRHDAGEHIAAGGIVPHRLEKRAVLFGVAVIVQKAAEEHAQHDVGRREQPGRRAEAAVRAVQRVKERKAGRRAERDDERTFIQAHRADGKHGAVHGVAPSPLSFAVAK